MSAESEKVREMLADQLAEFDQNLGETIGDAAMLADLKNQIGRLLATGAAERDIRILLQERFDRGNLRRETFQLVKSVLDRYTSEDVATSPFAEDGPPASLFDTHAELTGDDEFASTTVISQGLTETGMADSRVQPGSVLNDRYLIRQRVSGGSMGVVYQAVDRAATDGGNEAFVAIKVLSPKLSSSEAALRALQQEAAKGRCLLHPNIVRFIDLERDDDLSFLVMEWMPGRTLADLLDSPSTRRFGVDEALDIMRMIGQALGYAHRCGIVHADVKPGNIMILPNGTAKLFDFGVARIRQTTHPDDFDPGELGAVTPAYSSREVLSGEEPVAADDVYSLGCLMYRLIAGYRVFGPRNAAEAAAERMTPQRLDALSDSQWKALKKALSFSRAGRFESMDDFTDALGVGESIRVTPDQRLANEVDAGGSRSWMLIPLVLLVAAGGAYQAGLLDDYLGAPEAQEVVPDQADPVTRVESAPASPVSAPVTDESAPAPVATPTVEQLPQPADSRIPVDVAATVVDTESLAPEPEVTRQPPAEPVTDFSALPAADHELNLSDGSAAGTPLVISLRENARGATIDLFRPPNAVGGVNLKLEEVAHSGNRSPWTARQYLLSEDSQLRIPEGQDRARITLAMSPDPLREADQQSTLRIRVAELPRSELGLLEVILEDDDQRAFEAGLPPNTVAFAVSQMSVSERDPAVQVDIMRFNPDNRPLTIEYRLSNITATEGQDFFNAGDNTVSFAPGQRSARVLLPLGQDLRAEGDEAFAVELVGDTSASVDVYRRLVVLIRDDESG
jgi:serine/threonine protein kinase